MIYAQIILAVIPLAILIFNQFFSDKAKKAALQKLFDDHKAEVLKAVDEKLQASHAVAANVSAGQAAGWDAADADTGPPKELSAKPLA